MHRRAGARYGHAAPSSWLRSSRCCPSPLARRMASRTRVSRLPARGLGASPQRECAGQHDSEADGHDDVQRNRGVPVVEEAAARKNHQRQHDERVVDQRGDAARAAGDEFEVDPVVQVLGRHADARLEGLLAWRWPVGGLQPQPRMNRTQSRVASATKKIRNWAASAVGKIVQTCRSTVRQRAALQAAVALCRARSKLRRRSAQHDGNTDRCAQEARRDSGSARCSASRTSRPVASSLLSEAGAARTITLGLERTSLIEAKRRHHCKLPFLRR